MDISKDLIPALVRTSQKNGTRKCWDCDGVGKKRKLNSDHKVENLPETCEECNGKGEVIPSEDDVSVFIYVALTIFEYVIDARVTGDCTRMNALIDAGASYIQDMASRESWSISNEEMLLNAQTLESELEKTNVVSVLSVVSDKSPADADVESNEKRED